MRNAEAAIASMTETTVKASDAEIQLGADFETVSLSIESVYDNLSDLAEQYEEAYKQAKSSLEGQYGLWDDVAQVSDITVGSMGEKILKQTKYWQEYNTNLESLRDRAGDIEGLALVGEKGPELVSFRGGESVTTAAKTERILESQSIDGSMQISQNISITVEGGATEETMSQIRNAAEEFKEAVEEAVNYHNQSVGWMWYPCQK